MRKPTEYCPNCASIREMDQSLGMLTCNSQGEGILLYHYHCASCNAYLRSTTLDYQEVSLPIQVAVISIPDYV